MNPDNPDEVRKEKARRVREMTSIFNEIKREECGKFGDLDDDTRVMIYDTWSDTGLIKPIVKTVIKEIVRQPITSAEELEYARRWRQKQKLLKLQEEQQTRQQLKVKEALKRKNIYCPQCKSNVKCIDPKFELKQKRNSNKVRINVYSACPTCGTKAAGFGGYVPE